MISNNELDAILTEIIEDPDDDLSRLAYADWLNDFGSDADQDRANFIRFQVNAAKLPDGTERATLNQQADALLAAHRDEWKQPLHELGVTGIEWKRGFPANIIISAAAFITNGGQIIGAAPITQARIAHLPNDQIAAFANSPNLKNLTHLNLAGNLFGDAGAQALAASPHLKNLRDLNLEGNLFGAAGAEALADSPHLTNLTHLDLAGNQIGDAGAEALAASPYLKNLKDLDLGRNQIGAVGAEALATSPHLTNLRDLNLAGNQIGDAGAQALDSPNLTNLTRLDLTGNQIGDTGVQALATSPHLKNLRDLDLMANRIGNEGAQALAASPYLKNLKDLDLTTNQIGTSLLTQINRTMASRRSTGQGEGPGTPG